jgi:RHS repeat-associated protein
MARAEMKRRRPIGTLANAPLRNRSYRVLRAMLPRSACSIEYNSLSITQLPVGGTYDPAPKKNGIRSQRYSAQVRVELPREYDATGALIEETVWPGDIPVGTLRSSGSGVSIYYIHSDPLDTPREITRPSGNIAMWSWFSDPFGTDAANSNPAGVGAFTYNLRLPGQVFDGQAGLHQNGFRDYDPATGGYVESDPIGLAAGGG